MSKITRKPLIINVNRVCRACLSERGKLRDMRGTIIPKMIEACTTIKVSEWDTLPRLICVSCFQKIARFFAFKKKIERNDRILNNHIKNNRNKAKNQHKDILCKAVNEADIAKTIETVEGEEEEQEDLEKSEAKSDDTLLKDEIVIEETIITGIEHDFTLTENENAENASKLYFSDSPPPLIPIQITKKPESDSSAIIGSITDNTPPLIPIKAVTNHIDIEKLNSVDLRLECTACGDDFTSVVALKQHKQSQCHSTGLQCSICSKTFTDRKRLIGHLRGHMVKKDYVCKICNKRYPNPSTFKVHMRTHTGERPFKCQVCNKGFVRWAGVVGHMKTHTAYKPYKCETCGKAFKIASNLERHKVLHLSSLPYCCNFCGKTYSQADNLQLHIRTYHTFERPYLCSECGKGFVSASRLNRHMWIHSGFKPYKCKDCPKSYSNSNDLKNHSRTHAGGPSIADKPHVCNVCNLRFFHACRLKKHLAIHEKKECAVCAKTFASQELLQKHIQARHSEASNNKLEQTEEFVETFVFVDVQQVNESVVEECVKIDY